MRLWRGLLRIVTFPLVVLGVGLAFLVLIIVDLLDWVWKRR